METAKIVYESGLITEATHVFSGTMIKTDAPLDNNGTATSFSPTDLLSTSLATCMITLIGIKASASGVTTRKIRADVFKTMGINPRRVIKIKIDLYFELDFEKESKEIIEDAAKNCPVAKSIHPEIIQELSFNYLKY